MTREEPWVMTREKPWVMTREKPWVMTREKPWVGVGCVSETRGSSRVEPGGAGTLMGRVESGREVFKYRGFGRVTLTRSDPQIREKESDP